MLSAVWAYPIISWERRAEPSYFLGETRRAIDFYEQHLQIARKTGDRKGEGQVLSDLGIAYADLGETRRAIEFFEQQLQIARGTGDRRGEGRGLLNLTLTLDRLEDRAQAITTAEAALIIFEEIESPLAERMRNRLSEWKSG